MKRVILISFFFSLLTLNGCLQEKEEIASYEPALSVQAARNLYDSALRGRTTKTMSDQERQNMFYRESYVPNWALALPTHTDEVESIDIPVTDNRVYYVVTQDGQGYYLTECHHSLTIVNSKATKQTGVYHHFFIPFRDSRDKYHDSYEGDLYRGFHNNGFRDDFTGLEIYANMNGMIVKILRYSHGKLYTDLYSGNGNKEKERIQYNLRYYISKAYGLQKDIHTKDGAQYLCPQCGHELFEFNGYYYCSECDWNELDFWEQYLEECYFFDEGGGTGSGGNENDDPDPMNPNPDPDPNSGSGGQTGQGNGNSGIDQGDAPTWFDFDENALTYVLPSLMEIQLDCAGQILINSLQQAISIQFVENRQLGPLIAVKTPSNNYSTIARVEYNLNGIIRTSILFEELYHCFQIINNEFHPDWALNVEVEAKYATYKYAVHTGTTADLFIPPTCSSNWWDAFQSYDTNPSETNYTKMVDSVRVSSILYAHMPDNSSHHAMNSISTIFDCYTPQ